MCKKIVFKIHSEEDALNLGSGIIFMSKAARLKKEKEKRLKTDEAFRKKEEERKSVSKSAGKFIKKESVWFKILKLIMILPFLYSGFFYGGVSIISIFKRMISIDTYVGWIILLCLTGMLIAIILAFKRRYIVGFIVSAVSTTVYFFTTKKYFVDYARGKVTEDGNINPEYKYMRWFYPILLFLLCALILFIMSLVKIIKKKLREKAKKDNAPVKSIIDD